MPKRRRPTARLFHRHLGVHTLVKEARLRAGVAYIVGPKEDPTVLEEHLLADLPRDFLPAAPASILLTVGDPSSATAVSCPKRFRRWGKYFDCYCLEVSP